MKIVYDHDVQVMRWVVLVLLGGNAGVALGSALRREWGSAIAGVIWTANTVVVLRLARYYQIWREWRRMTETLHERKHDHVPRP